MASAVPSDAGFTELAVAMGRVEQDVKHIRSDGEKSSANFIQFQLSVQNELKELDVRTSKNTGDIAEIITKSKTNMRWLSGITVSIQVVGMVVFGIMTNFIK